MTSIFVRQINEKATAQYPQRAQILDFPIGSILSVKYSVSGRDYLFTGRLIGKRRASISSSIRVLNDERVERIFFIYADNIKSINIANHPHKRYHKAKLYYLRKA